MAQSSPPQIAHRQRGHRQGGQNAPRNQGGSGGRSAPRFQHEPDIEFLNIADRVYRPDGSLRSDIKSHPFLCSTERIDQFSLSDQQIIAKYQKESGFSCLSDEQIREYYERLGLGTLTGRTRQLEAIRKVKRTCELDWDVRHPELAFKPPVPPSFTPYRAVDIDRGMAALPRSCRFVTSTDEIVPTVQQAQRDGLPRAAHIMYTVGWVAWIVDFRSQVITFYDPLGYSYTNRTSSQAIVDELARSFHLSIVILEGRHQTNSYSSGLYSMIFVLRSVLGLDFVDPTHFLKQYERIFFSNRLSSDASRDEIRFKVAHLIRRLKRARDTWTADDQAQFDSLRPRRASRRLLRELEEFAHRVQIDARVETLETQICDIWAAFRRGRHSEH